MKTIMMIISSFIFQTAFALTPSEYCNSLPLSSCEVLNTDVYVIPGTSGTPGIPGSSPVLVGNATPTGGGGYTCPSGTNLTGTVCMTPSTGGSPGTAGTSAQLIKVVKQCKNRVFEVKTDTISVPAGTSGNFASCL